MSKDGKTRYIIEIKYAHDKKGDNEYLSTIVPPRSNIQALIIYNL